MRESYRGRLKMFCYLPILVFMASLCWTPADSRVIQKRAAFYIANETMCIVDGDVYRNGDPVPTDDECERCTCRPPGFSCVLRDCDTKPGCKAVRKAGECCPEYVCGCVHNNRLYEDGELIKDLQNNCYTCRCHGSSISCTFADCRFRGDCPPEYVPGECCPRYDHCPVISTTTTTITPSTASNIVQQEIEFINITTQHLEKFTTEGITVTIEDIATTPTYDTVSVKFTLSGEKISSIQDFDTTILTTLLPLETVTYKESTKHIITPPGTELTTLKEGLIVDGFDETTTESFSHTTFATKFDSSADTVPPTDIIDVQTTTSESPESSEKSDSLTTQESDVSVSETFESGGAGTTHEVSTYDHGYMHLSTSEKYDINDTLLSAVTTDSPETPYEVTTHDHGYMHLSTSEKYDINDTLLSTITIDGTETTVKKETHSVEASEFINSTDMDSIEEKNPMPAITHPTTAEESSKSSTEHIKSVTTAIPTTTKIDENVEDSEADSESVENDLHASSVEIHAVTSTTELDSDSLHTYKNETEIILKNESDEGSHTEDETQTTNFSNVTDSTTLQKEIHETTSSEFSTLTPEVQKETSETSTYDAHVTTSHSDYQTSLDSQTSDSLDTTSGTTPHFSEVEHPETSTQVDELVELSSIQSPTTVEVSPLDTSTKFEGSSDTPISSLGIITNVDDSIINKVGITISSQHMETTPNYTSIDEASELDSAPDFPADNETSPGISSTVSDKLDLHAEYNSAQTSTISSTDKDITTLFVSSNPTDVAKTKMQHTTSISEFPKTTILHDTKATTVDSNEFKSDITFEAKQTTDYAETRLKVTHGSSHVDVEIENDLLTSQVPEIEDSPSTSDIINGSLSIEDQESDFKNQDTTIESSSFKASTSGIIFEKEEKITPTVIYVPQKTSQEDATSADSEDTAAELEVLTTELSLTAAGFHTDKDGVPTTPQSLPLGKETSTPPSTEESETSVTDETGIAKHATQIFTTTTTEFSRLETTSLKLVENITTTESNLPSAFEPPLANILKQQMLFRKQQVTEKTSTLASIPVKEIESSHTNVTWGTVAENDTLKHSLTLDETIDYNDDNESLIHEEAENVFVLNHEYTIPDSEISIVEMTDFDDEHNESTETNTHLDTEDKILQPNHIYNENGDSFVDVMDSEDVLNETTYDEEIVKHEISNVLPDTFVDQSLTAEETQGYSVNNTDNNIISNFSKESSIHDVQTTSYIQESEKVNSSGVIDAKDSSRHTTTVTSVGFSENNIALETSTEGEKQDDGNEASTVDLDFVSKMSTSYDINEKDNKHTEAEYNTDNLQESHNETDLEYLDAENSESSEDDKESSATVSASYLHPELTSEGISDTTSSLNSGFTESKKESILITDKRTTVSATTNSKYASTLTQSDDEQVTVSTEADMEIPQEGTTIQINILFGQDSFDPLQIHKKPVDHSLETSGESNLQEGHLSVHREVPVNSEVKIMISEEIKNNDTESTKHKLDFGDQNIKEHSLVEISEFSTSSEEINENLNSKVDSYIHSSQHNLNVTKDSIDLVSITSDSTTSYPEENIFTTSFDESNSKDSITTVGESSSPFTILEYLGELFSGVGTFSTSTDTIDNKTAQSTSEFSTETGNTEFNDAATVDSSDSSKQKYSSELKDEFATYGQLGGVFITGQSKYNKSSLNENNQNADNNTLIHNSDNKSEENYNSGVNDSTYYNVHKQDPEEIMESEEFSEVTETSINSAEKDEEVDEIMKENSKKESIREEEILNSESTSKVSDFENDEKFEFSDPVGTDASEKENMPLTMSTIVTSIESKEPNDSLLVNTEIKEGGPEKSGEWFESTDPDLSLANFDTEKNDITTLSVVEVENGLSTTSTGAPNELENESNFELQAVSSINNTSSKNESVNLDSDEKDSLFPKTDIEHEGPEKGGEWFEATEPDLTLANAYDENNTTILRNEKENNSILITSTDSNYGPEKGGEVFEPTMPDLFPISRGDAEIKNNISNVNATENVAESIQKSVLSKNDFSPDSPESESETKIDTVHSEFIPPLPILLKGINKHVQRNNTSEHNQVLNDAGNEETITADADSEEITSPSSKVAFSRSFNHRFHMSDVISKVFKAPGYDAEVQLSPLQGFASLKKSKVLRLKRDVTDIPEENPSPPQTVNIDSQYLSSKNPYESTHPINTKNVLLVEGYGQKPSGFFPVTSSFIIVHSDEDEQENETEVDPKRKPSRTQPGETISGENLPEKIMFANQEGNVDPSTTKIHSTKR